MFRGLYPDFASAPPLRLLASGSAIQRRRDGDTVRARTAHHLSQRLSGHVLARSEARLLFDLGGNVGNRYLSFRKYLAYPEDFTWLVHVFRR
jgi:hypothetical protein